jgi:hypothetical protein
LPPPARSTSLIQLEFHPDTFNIMQIQHLPLVSEDTADASGQDSFGQIDVEPLACGDEFQKEPEHQEAKEQAEYFAVGISPAHNMKQGEGQGRQAEDPGDKEQQTGHLPDNDTRAIAADQIHTRSD